MRFKFIAVFMFIAVFSVTYISVDVINKNIFKELEASTTVIENENEQQYRYRVSVFNGKLAVFENNSKIPYKVYDTYIDTLPYEDRTAVEKGIFTDSSAELMKIIEDYTS